MNPKKSQIYEYECKIHKVISIQFRSIFEMNRDDM